MASMQLAGVDLSIPLPHTANAWMEVSACPACEATERRALGEIPDHYYVFGSERIGFPGASIGVYGCSDCGLVYKSPVPSDAMLASLFVRYAKDKWGVAYDYSRERRCLAELIDGVPFDLLDVGASDGSWLAACAGLAGGRRSALDVLPYPGLERRLRGEFIHAALDAPQLPWSRQPYDVVTAFDVVEHLYRPAVAFANLAELVRRGGWLWIETGCTESYWPRRFGAQQWWYVRLIEHHVFWSRVSLERVASAHGFTLEHCEYTRHKRWRSVPALEVGIELLKTGMYCAATRRYGTMAQRFGREGNQPWFPFAHDHLRTLFRRR